MTNAAVQRLHDLSFAIFSSDYAKVQEFLADDSFPVNLYFPRYKKLPRDLVIETQDPKMIRLFLKCPRVDWLTPNELNLDELDAYGIEYDQILRKEQKSVKKVDLFQCLDPWFEQVRPEEAKLIYDKMFEALEREPEDDLEELVFKTFRSKYAFSKALHFCKDINKTTENGSTVLHLICERYLNLFEQAQLAVSKGANIQAKKMTEALLKNLLSDESDFYAPIDDEGNTILHYQVLKHLEIEAYNGNDSLDKLQVYDNQKNKAGLTALDLLVRSPTLASDLIAGFDIKTVSDLKLLEARYDEFHGFGAFDSQVFSQVGAALFLIAIRAGCLETAQYFFKEKRISPERFCISLRHKWTGPVLYQGWTDTLDWITFALDSGIDFIDALFANSWMCRDLVISAYNYQLTARKEDLSKLFFALVQNIVRLLNEDIIGILQCPQMNSFLKANSSFSEKLLKHFFGICHQRAHVELLLSLGLDPRQLAARNILSEGCIVSWNLDMWTLLRDELGITLEDFDDIYFKFDSSEAPFTLCADKVAVTLKEKVAFEEDALAPFKFTFEVCNVISKSFSEISLDSGLKFKDCCYVCRDDFEANDRVIKLDCGHIFHSECVNQYLFMQQQCPYCRVPSPYLSEN